MQSLAKRGAKWFRDKLPDAAAEVVEIRSDSEVLAEVEAIPGHRDWQQFAIEQATGSEETFDWILVEQDLVFPIAGKREPAPGWQIRAKLSDGRTAIYTVRPEQPKGRAFDRVDQYGLMYRTHTKFERIER